MPARTSHDTTSLIGARSKGNRLQDIVSGYISMEQPAPTSFNANAYVVIPSHNPEGSTALTWPAIHGNTMPAQGAAALVAYDQNSVPYLVWWAGTHS